MDSGAGRVILRDDPGRSALLPRALLPRAPSRVPFPRFLPFFSRPTPFPSLLSRLG
ncbi:hypothetical protein HDA33_002121 [Micrococcus endophyticus]|uniref:Uncharacterized protein n=1 Tax=Micrococcus endophyticus TaxID=455343 RepID=A0A7W9N1X6_9MICC|nr:hypothetical protein [Micrococcus endophyticus]